MLLFRTGGSSIKQRTGTGTYPHVVAWNNLTYYSKGKKQKKERERKGNRKEKKRI
jgi:hypothetical protein